MDKLHRFYTGKAWRDLSYTLKIKRGGCCERCGWQAVEKNDWSKLIGHHKIELTEDNVDDPNVSLNANDVEIICLDCHNKEHRRFGSGKKVYIVYGSPLSGKTTLARELMRYGDIVLDMDELWRAVTLQEKYIKPDPCRFNVFRLRDNLLEQIKMRYGNFYDAYIIGGYPDKYERERLAGSLGAELIYCDSTKEECLKRREESGKPKVWDEYINKWFDEYNG